jgi:hypothetical protein
MTDGVFEMELSRSEYQRFAEECRCLAKSAKTVDEQEFLLERASWVVVAEESQSQKPAAKYPWLLCMASRSSQ